MFLKQNCQNTSFSFNFIFFNKYTVANIDLSKKNQMISLEKKRGIKTWTNSIFATNSQEFI